MNGPTEFTNRYPAPVQFTTDGKKFCKTDDILFCVRGSTTGRMNWANRKYAIGRGIASISHKHGQEYRYFVKGVLDYHLPSLLASATGSTFPNVSKNQLENLEIDIPPFPEQKAIADVLNSLDDKIDLLQRQNQTLEALAQTLFRQWFIEEAGDEWEGKPLDTIAEYLNGLACQKYPPENDFNKLPVLKIKELRNGITEQSDWATSKVPEEYIVENGDVIFSWSGSLMVKIWDGSQCVLNQHLFKVTSEKYPKWFYYFWTIHHLEKFIAIAESKATTMGHIKRGDLSNSMVSIPGNSELDDMDQVISPLFDKIILNNQQMAKLTSLRDLLLPKLMSGEVRVKLEN